MRPKLEGYVTCSDCGVGVPRDKAVHTLRKGPYGTSFLCEECASFRKSRQANLGKW